jgi:hypothetical protein
VYIHRKPSELSKLRASMVSPVAGCKADSSKPAPIADMTATNAAIIRKRVAGCGSLLPTLSIESRILLKWLFAIVV